MIEGVFAVPDSSPLKAADEIDRSGVRIGVNDGSAYDLFLSRTLLRAEVVRGRKGTAAFVDQNLDVPAGIRAPMTDFVAQGQGLRILAPSFMKIRQAFEHSSRKAGTLRYLYSFIEERKADGFITSALARSGRQDARVAPRGA